jgi:hypothetical protein
MCVAHQVFMSRIEGVRSMPYLVCSILLFVIADHHNQRCGLQLLLRAPTKISARTDQRPAVPVREFPGPPRSLARLRYRYNGYPIEVRTQHKLTVTTLYRNGKAVCKDYYIKYR